MHESFTILAQAATPPPAGTDPTVWLVWGIVLLAMAVALFFVEAFLPTGGIVGALSGLAAVSGVVCLFWRDSTLGLLAATGVLLAIPFAIAFMLKVAPDTPFAKWVTLKESQEAVTQRTDSDVPLRRASASDETQAIKPGDSGETLTPLFPVGTCLIIGRREECLAKHGTIDKGTVVRVVSVDGSEVYVTPVENREG